MTQIELAAQVQILKSSYENAQLSKEEFKALVYSLFEQAAMADVYKTYTDLNLQVIFTIEEAYFAQLDQNNIVTQVIVVPNNELLDNGTESESKGIDFCKSLYGADTVWKQTSYDGTFRRNFAGIGFLYNQLRDAFIQPRPYSTWILNNDTYQWEAPIPCPVDDRLYAWDEYTNNWVDIGEKST
jgi:hypothetical protein